MVKIDIPLYSGEIRVFADREECSEHWLELEDEEPNMEDFAGIAQEIITDDGSRIYMVGIFDGKISTLIHELTHVCIFIAEHAEWEVCNKTSEPFCYLLEDLFQKAYKPYKDQLS